MKTPADRIITVIILCNAVAYISATDCIDPLVKTIPARISLDGYDSGLFDVEYLLTDPHVGIGVESLE
jgi:hypothetical protein